MENILLDRKKRNLKIIGESASQTKSQDPLMQIHYVSGNQIKPP